MDDKANMFQYVLVGYKPASDEILPQNAIVLFDGPCSANFQHLIPGGLTIPVGGRGGDHRPSSIRMQLATRQEITDPYANELLAKYYDAIEKADYETVGDCVTDDVVYRMHPNINDPKPRLVDTLGVTREFLVQDIKDWIERNGAIRYEIEWSIVSSAHGLVRFVLVNDAGHRQECQCAYTFQVTNMPNKPPKYRISSISHFTAADRDPAMSMLRSS
jgi:hypothetical protein